MDNTSKLNFTSIITITFIFVICIIPISVIIEVLKIYIPIVFWGELFRTVVVISLFAIIWSLVIKLNISNPELLKRGIIKVKSLPTGWYRLGFTIWFVIPIIILAIFIEDIPTAIMVAIFSLVIFWPLTLLIVWIIDGFREN